MQYPSALRGKQQSAHKQGWWDGRAKKETGKPTDESSGGRHRLGKIFDKLRSKKHTSKALHAYYTEDEEIEAFSLPPGPVVQLSPNHHRGGSWAPARLPKVHRNKHQQQREVVYHWVPTAVLWGQSSERPGSPRSYGRSQSLAFDGSSLRGPVCLPRWQVSERSQNARENFATLVHLLTPVEAFAGRSPCWRILLDETTGGFKMEEYAGETVESLRSSATSSEESGDIVIAVRHLLSLDCTGTKLDAMALSDLAVACEREIADITSPGENSTVGCLLVPFVRCSGTSSALAEVFTWRADLFELDNEEPQSFAEPPDFSSSSPSPGPRADTTTPSLYRSSSPSSSRAISVTPSLYQGNSKCRLARQSSSMSPLLTDIVKQTGPRPQTPHPLSPLSPEAKTDSGTARPVTLRSPGSNKMAPESSTQLSLAIKGGDSAQSRQEPLLLLEGASYPLRYAVSPQDTALIQRQLKTLQPLGHKAVIALVPATATVTCWASLVKKASLLVHLDPGQAWGSTSLPIPEDVTSSQPTPSRVAEAILAPPKAASAYSDDRTDCRSGLLELCLYVADDKGVGDNKDRSQTDGQCMHIGPRIPCKILRPPRPDQMLAGLNQCLEDFHSTRGEEAPLNAMTSLIISPNARVHGASTWQGIRSNAPLLCRVQDRRIKPSQVVIIRAELLPRFKQMLPFLDGGFNISNTVNMSSFSAAAHPGADTSTLSVSNTPCPGGPSSVSETPLPGAMPVYDEQVPFPCAACAQPVVVNANSDQCFVACGYSAAIKWQPPPNYVFPVLRYRLRSVRAGQAVVYQHTSGTETTTTLNGLPPGKYTVSVQAGTRQGFGPWSQQSKFWLLGPEDIGRQQSVLDQLTTWIGHEGLEIGKLESALTRTWKMVGDPPKPPLKVEMLSIIQVVTQEWLRRALDLDSDRHILTAFEYIRRADAEWESIIGPKLLHLLNGERHRIVEVIKDHPQLWKHMKAILESLANQKAASSDARPSKFLSALYYTRLAGMQPGGLSPNADLLSLEMNWKMVKNVLEKMHDTLQNDLKALRKSTPLFEDLDYCMELDNVAHQDEFSKKIIKLFQDSGMSNVEVLSVDRIILPNEERAHYNRTRDRLKQEYGEDDPEREVWIGTGTVDPLRTIQTGRWNGIFENCQTYGQLGRALYCYNHPFPCSNRAFINANPSLEGVPRGAHHLTNKHMHGAHQLLLCKVVVGSCLRRRNFHRTWWGYGCSEQELSAQARKVVAPPAGCNMVSYELKPGEEKAAQDSALALYSTSVALPMCIVSYKPKNADGSHSAGAAAFMDVKEALAKPLNQLSERDMDDLRNFGLDLVNLDGSKLDQWLQDGSKVLKLSHAQLQPFEQTWSLYRMIQNARASGDAARLQGAIAQTKQSLREGEVGHMKPLLQVHCEDAETTLEKWSNLGIRFKAALDSGVAVDLEQILVEAKSANFDKKEIEKANIALERWRTLRGAVDSQDTSAIGRAVQQAKNLQVCEAVVKEVEDKLKCMNTLRHWLSQPDASAGLMQQSLDRVLAHGIGGKLVQIAKGAIRAREMAEQKKDSKDSSGAR